MQVLGHWSAVEDPASKQAIKQARKQLSKRASKRASKRKYDIETIENDPNVGHDTTYMCYAPRTNTNVVESTTDVNE